MSEPEQDDPYARGLEDEDEGYVEPDRTWEELAEAYDNFFTDPAFCVPYPTPSFIPEDSSPPF